MCGSDCSIEKIGIEKALFRLRKNAQFGLRSEIVLFNPPIRLHKIGLRSQKPISFVQIETGLLCEIGCGDGARVICLFALVIQQLGFWTQKVQANVDYCCVWRREDTRRVHFARSWTQAFKPVLTESSLAAKKHAAALHVLFSQPSIRGQHVDCCCC